MDVQARGGPYEMEPALGPGDERFAQDRPVRFAPSRPMTPDGLPAIGRLPGHRGIYVATGHNMLGLTLGPATGRLITDLLGGATATAFDPARIARRY